MSRSMASESAQLHWVVRSAALSHKEQYYALRMARYPGARAEDMRRRQIVLERSKAWELQGTRQQRGGLLIPHAALRLLYRGLRIIIISYFNGTT